MKLRHMAMTLAAASAMAVAAPSFAQADNTNSRIAPAETQGFSTWMNDYSTAHQGRISRQAYMDEMSRRWDAADAQRRGLSVEEINRAYGWSANRDPVTGANTAPGYMGPRDTKK